MTSDTHRIGCGDCRDPETVSQLFDGRKANIAFTSPPYADRRVYDATTEFRPIPPDEYVDWFEAVAANVAEHLADDGSWFVNIKPSAEGLDTDLYVLDLVAAHVRRWGWHLATEFCWERNGIPKHVRMRFKNQFEPVYQFTKGPWKIRPDNVHHWSDNPIVPLGPGSGIDTDWEGHQGAGGAVIDRSRTNHDVGSRDLEFAQGGAKPFIYPEQMSGQGGWAYPGNRLPTFMSSHEATGHAAAFPVGLPEWFIKAFTDPGDIVFDPFLGSGSTLLAAHRTGRICYGLEISPAYCDVTLRRFETHTAIRPVRSSTDEAVSFLESEPA